MTTLAFFGEPRMPRLSKLLQEIRRGEILVPRFQRPFVWTDEQRLALMESIYSGYPIGAILVWRTQEHRLVTYEGLGPLRLPADAEGQSTRQYLLDGHQRMATLFAALGPGLYAGEEHEEPPWLEDDDGEERARWPLYFDLEAERQPFQLPRRRGAVPPTWLPLDKLLDPFSLREFEDTLRTHKRDRKIVNRVQSIAEVFRDYVIPVMPIATEDLAQITVSFKRINSGGTSMSEVHMVNALVHGPNFDLLQELDNLATELKPVGWESFDQQMILNICKARLGLSLYDEDAEKIAEKIREKPDVLHGVRDDILGVARVLDRIANVRGPGCLPYSYQAVLLADALHEIGNPSKKLIERLRQWFWSTTLTEYFRGMTKSLFERARAHLHALVEGQVDPAPPDLPQTVEPSGRFDFRSARSRAIALLLAELDPVDPDGNSVAAFDLLAQNGVGALSRIVGEREAAAGIGGRTNGPENRFLVPPRHAAQLRAALEGPKLGLDAEALATHAISTAAAKALRKRAWSEFLTHRRTAIQDLEHGRAKECGLDYRRAAK